MKKDKLKYLSYILILILLVSELTILKADSGLDAEYNDKTFMPFIFLIDTNNTFLNVIVNTIPILLLAMAIRSALNYRVNKKVYDIFVFVFYFAMLSKNYYDNLVFTPELILKSKYFYLDIVIEIIFIIEYYLLIKVLRKYNIINDDYKAKKLSNREIHKLLGNDFNIKEFYNTVFNIYKKIQIAWMNNKIDDVREYLSESIYENYKSLLEELNENNEQNIMESINFVKAGITNISLLDECEYISVMLNVTCIDYIINTKTNTTVKGSRYKRRRYIYELRFARTKNDNYSYDYVMIGKDIKYQI